MNVKVPSLVTSSCYFKNLIQNNEKKRFKANGDFGPEIRRGKGYVVLRPSLAGTFNMPDSSFFMWHE